MTEKTVEKGTLIFVDREKSIFRTEPPEDKFEGFQVLHINDKESIEEVIERCRKEKPDVLVLEGASTPPGVNDLRLLSEAAKELQMMVMVARQRKKTGEMPLKGSSES